MIDYINTVAAVVLSFTVSFSAVLAILSLRRRHAQDRRLDAAISSTEKGLNDLRRKFIKDCHRCPQCGFFMYFCFPLPPTRPDGDPLDRFQECHNMHCNPLSPQNKFMMEAMDGPLNGVVRLFDLFTGRKFRYQKQPGLQIDVLTGRMHQIRRVGFLWMIDGNPYQDPRDWLNFAVNKTPEK